MNGNALEIHGLTKTFYDFKLDDISFSLPAGFIMGLVGKNGAGKTTTIKLIFDLLQKENGLIKILGNDTANNYDFKQNVAVVFDDLFFVDDWNIDDVEKAFSPFYGRWNKNEFQSYLNKFNLNRKKKIKECSKGMKLKLSLAVALSHQARLLILDEPTSGLDPVARDELLDILLEYIEGEPVRRHVSDAVLKYDKPVYGMFIAVRIDTNTAETFRHGIWYTKDDTKQRLDIVPLTLAQFQKYFVAMFEANKAAPEKLRDLIVKCESRRDILEAPAWKQYIDSTVAEKSLEITNGIIAPSGSEIPLVPAGAIVRHVAFGEGQVVALEANFPECPAKTVELPYLRSLPDEVSFCADGKTLLHDRFGEGTVFAYIVVFKNHMMPLTYPATFEAGDMFLV